MRLGEIAAFLTTIIIPVTCTDSDSLHAGPGMTVTHELSLGDESGPGLLGLPIAITRDTHGRYLVVTESDPSVILVFDSTGRWVRSMGRSGSGPGEYRWILALAPGPGDSISVFDVGLRRRTVLAPDLRPARSHPLPGQWFPRGAAILPDGRIILNDIQRSDSGFGFAFQLVGPLGDPIRSFGEYRGVLTPSSVYQTLVRPFALTRSGRVVAGFEWQYRFEEWDPDRPALIRELHPPADGFGGPPLEPEPVSAQRPPRPKVRAIIIDGRGALLVARTIPDRRWRNQLVKRTGPDGTTTVIDDYSKFYDSRLEVIDSASGAVIASQQIDEMVFAFLDEGHCVSLHQEDNGVVRLDIWRLSTDLKGH